MRPGLIPAVLGLALSGMLSVAAQPRDAAPPEAEKIGDDLYRLGKVKVDLKARAVICSGSINMRRMPVEYLAVAPGGPRHESVLLIPVRPLHLQLGLILLGLEPKGGIRFQGDSQLPQGSRVRINVSWRMKGKTVKVPAEQLVWDISKKAPMEAGGWVFSGGLVDDEGFVADRDLQLIGTFRDPAAIINNALPAGDDDTAYKPNERLLPPVETPVTVSITPG